MARIILLVFLFIPLALKAQFNYTLDQAIPVYDLNNKQLTMPWAGGVNASQYNTLDLNGDGNIDLVLFDRMANKVLTYLNEEGQYLYAPGYEALFPKDIANWILLRDYNCDGKKDLFTSDVLGIRVYTNITSPGGALSWKQFFFFAVPGEPKSPVLLTKGFNNLINLQLQYDDLPSIIDADGDGDLDIFSMQYSGNTAEFHRNYSKEEHGTCDSLIFKRETQSWGGFTDCGCGNFAFNGSTTCPPQSGRVEHVGGKSILTLDVDGDNDLDFIYSESTCTNLYLLKNDGTTENPLINTHTNFPITNPAIFYIFPAAYHEDLDFDGLKDIVVAPNIYSKTFLNTNLSASSWLYKNTGTAQKPNYTFVKNNFLQDQMIDLGDNSVPAFADYDGDGDYDLFISQNASQSFRSTLYFYENIGSANAPEFKLQTTDYLGLSLNNSYNLKIQFVDLNADKKMDLVYTTTSLQSGLTRAYYIVDVFHVSLPFGEPFNLSVTTADNIYFTDIGGTNGKPDGNIDVLIGKNSGALEYWENNGGFNFALKNATFLGIKTSVTRQNPSCTIGDLDNDGKSDLVTSDQSGVLTIISNFLEANENSERITEIVLSPLTDSTYVARNFGGRAWPTIVNLYNTNRPNIVVGNILGGVQVLKHNESKSLLDEPVIRIYPNPVAHADDLIVKVDRDATVQIFSSLGQRITDSIVIKGHEVNSFKDNALANGVYFFRFTFGKKSYTKRVVIY